MLLSSLTNVLFYVFSAILALSCFFAVSAKRSVHAVLFLVLAFFASAWVFITLKAEFIAMLLIIIYVGAIAVLFLFVVMMLEEPNEEVKHFKRGKLNFLFSALIGGILFAELFVIILSTKVGVESYLITKTFSIRDVGLVLYTQYFFEFQTIGLVFFTAMVGAIMLTMFKPDPKTKTVRQNFLKQISRKREDTMTLENPKPNTGVKID